MNKRARTKIIATIGPASSDYSVLRKMMLAGMDVARLNFSHGEGKEHQNRIGFIRVLNKRYRRRVRILGDLEGYRIRVLNLWRGESKILKKNAKVWLSDKEDDGDPSFIPFDYKGDLKDIGPGREIFIDDGKIILSVTGSSSKKLKASVVEGGELKERKGINIPGVKMPFAGMTEKDLRSIRFAISNRLDLIAQSFVRTAAEVLEVKDMISPSLPGCRVIAKIESREAIKNIDGIIEASDGIMIARGDMGIAVPIYTIPVVQKMIIKKCNEAKKPVITATQMLESMTDHSRPTRAEVTDVANAILDGTDMVMLSGETAVGHFPSETVKMMDRIIKYTETHEKEMI